jgi:NADPH2:quinone reductase
VRAALIIDGRVEVVDRPDPEPGEGQILVRVRAAGLNGADLIKRRRSHPASPGAAGEFPGLELTGVVVACGVNANRFAVGSRVMAVVSGAGQAELAVLHEMEAMPVPVELEWVDAGGLPLVFTTAHDALCTKAGLTAGERLCVHGAAGGVGTAAVQLGVAIGAQVTATVRSPERRTQVAGLGATVIDPEVTADYGPFDVVLELIGSPNLAVDLDSIEVGARICVIGVAGGTVGEINLGQLMMSQGHIIGSTLRGRGLGGNAAAARLVELHVLPLFEAGRLIVPVDATFHLEDASAAYDHFAAGGKFGKVVLISS